MTDFAHEFQRFRVKQLCFANGERFSGMIDVQGMLMHGPNVYAMEHLRQRAVAASTMDAHMRSIALGGIIYAAGLYSRYVTPADVAGRLQAPAVVQPAPPALPPPVQGGKLTTP